MIPPGIMQEFPARKQRRRENNKGPREYRTDSESSGKICVCFSFIFLPLNLSCLSAQPSASSLILPSYFFFFKRDDFFFIAVKMHNIKLTILTTFKCTDSTVVLSTFNIVQPSPTSGGNVSIHLQNSLPRNTKTLSLLNNS